jgi:hypothetical protein
MERDLLRPRSKKPDGTSIEGKQCKSPPLNNFCFVTQMLKKTKDRKSEGGREK